MIDKIYIIGSGLFGSVLAERLSTISSKDIIVIEKRNHIGGNCFSYNESETSINCHKYGAHIFHTSDREVYEYLTRFCQLNHYRHRVFTRSADGKVFPMPICLDTINKFFDKNFTPTECKNFLTNLIKKTSIESPQNLEEQAISLIGEELYNAFIKGYTHKQWQKDPRLLPAFIISRLPFRTNYNQDYFNDLFQGIPIGGYTPIFEQLLSAKNIHVELNTDFSDVKNDIKTSDLVIYTGPLDYYFDYCYGELEWRSLNFEWQVVNCDDFQGCAVMNEASVSVPYTRTHEFKHFHPENLSTFRLNKTIICKEFSKSCSKLDIPYYPINTSDNIQLFGKYLDKANRIENLVIGGRLATYKYLDMDKVIRTSLDTFEDIKKLIK